DEYPTVTGYMQNIVEFVGDLVETNHAYVSNTGDVWLKVASFPDYGKLSRRHLNSQLTAARKELEPGKEDPRDFALWKAAKPGEPIDNASDVDTATITALEEAMDAHLNAPDAVAAIFDLAREVNRQRETGSADLERGRRTIVHLLDVLGIDLFADAPWDQHSIG